VTTPGIDVSNHQGVIDWPRVAASGVRFAGMKASGDEGIGNVYVDPTFPDNWHQSRANGLVGSPTTTPGRRSSRRRPA
jgi:lysozyme